MSEEIRYEWSIVMPPDDFPVAEGSAATEVEARRELFHYAQQYAEDGKVELKLSMVTRKEIKP